MLSNKDSFIFRKRYFNQISKLTAEQKAVLLDKICEYQSTGTFTVSMDSTDMLMEIMIDDWAIDDEKYSEVCERNRENGKRGGRPPKNHKNPVGLSKPKKADYDSDIGLLSKDNNVEESTEQKSDNEILYLSYPFKDKGIDKQVCDKLIDKQLQQGATRKGMLKEMKLEQLELRIKQGNSHRYGRKLERRLREYVEGMADSEDRLRELLAIHRKRLESGPPYRKNPRDELCDLFGTDYVKRLFMGTKQGVKLFTT